MVFALARFKKQKIRNVLVKFLKKHKIVCVDYIFAFLVNMKKKKNYANSKFIIMLNELMSFKNNWQNYCFNPYRFLSDKIPHYNSSSIRFYHDSLSNVNAKRAMRWTKYL